MSKKKVKLLPQHVRDAQRKCNKMKKDLMMHEKEEKPFNCSQCDKRLCKGCAAVMREESCFACPKCCKIFSCLSDLKKHEINIKPSICAGCNSAPNTSNQLKEHEITHANDEPFSCAHCDKIFCNKADIIHARDGGPQLLQYGLTLHIEPCRPIYLGSSLKA